MTQGLQGQLMFRRPWRHDKKSEEQDEHMNAIFCLSMPPPTYHLLQQLDVGV